MFGSLALSDTEVEILHQDQLRMVEQQKSPNVAYLKNQNKKAHDRVKVLFSNGPLGYDRGRKWLMQDVART